MINLKDKWKKFFNLVLDPWFSLFTLITVVALFLSAILKENIITSNLLAIFGSITGSISGGIFQNQSNKYSGESVLEKKDSLLFVI